MLIGFLFTISRAQFKSAWQVASASLRASPDRPSVALTLILRRRAERKKRFPEPGRCPLSPGTFLCSHCAFILPPWVITAPPFELASRTGYPVRWRCSLVLSSYRQSQKKGKFLAFPVLLGHPFPDLPSRWPAPLVTESALPPSCSP